MQADTSIAFSGDYRGEIETNFFLLDEGLELDASFDWLELLNPDILVLNKEMWERNLETRHKILETVGSMVLYERMAEAHLEISYDID
jgi:hypothetical protein